MITKFILLFLVWIGLTNSIDPQDLIVGVIASAFVAVTFTSNVDGTDLKTTIFKYIKFAPIFAKNLVQANLDVAKIVLNPKLPTNTAIAKLSTSLTNDYDKLILANAITLTPGTITLELDGNDLYVHILDLNTTDKEQLEESIIKEFEKGLA